MEEFSRISILGLLIPSFSLDDFSWLCERVSEGCSLSECLAMEECPPALDRWVKTHSDWPDLLERERERVEKIGARLVYPGHPDYPPSLFGLHSPPTCLTLLGDAIWMRRRGLSVVGSREPMPESERWMQSEFSSFLERENAFVLSGAARGIDQLSHSIALMKKRPTVAILPSGLGEIYPRDFGRWKQSILDGGGALLSEYPVYRPMRKSSFHRRNRLIAGMTERLLLVESRRRSGSLMTAHLALEIHAEVGIIPHHPLYPKSRGGLDLLRQGASLIIDADDLWSWFSGARPPQRPNGEP